MPDIATIVMVETETFQKGDVTRSRGLSVAFRSMTASQAS